MPKSHIIMSFTYNQIIHNRSLNLMVPCGAQIHQTDIKELAVAQANCRLHSWRPTSTYVLCLQDRNEPSIPAGGGSLYLSSIKGNLKWVCTVYVQSCRFTRLSLTTWTVSYAPFHDGRVTVKVFVYWNNCLVSSLPFLFLCSDSLSWAVSQSDISHQLAPPLIPHAQKNTRATNIHQPPNIGRWPTVGIRAIKPLVVLFL